MREDSKSSVTRMLSEVASTGQPLTIHQLTNLHHASRTTGLTFVIRRPRFDHGATRKTEEWGGGSV
jgi:hypothetical protein